MLIYLNNKVLQEIFSLSITGGKFYVIFDFSSFLSICVIRYMEEVVESTFSLLSVNHEPNHPASPDFLSPVYFLALLDIKAVWFKKWTVSKKTPSQQPMTCSCLTCILKSLIYDCYYHRPIVS